MPNPKIVHEWTGDSAGGFTAVVQRTANGRWRIGTKGSPGDWAGDYLDYVDDVAAMRFLIEIRGYVPPNSYEYFPPEMLEDDYELPPEVPDPVIEAFRAYQLLPELDFRQDPASPWARDPRIATHGTWTDTMEGYELEACSDSDGGNPAIHLYSPDRKHERWSRTFGSLDNMLEAFEKFKNGEMRPVISLGRDD